MIDFTEQQIQRYSRHILLKDVGVEGQEKIMDARVLVVGAGGLGSPVSLYLAAAGIGTIGVVDADVVDLSNLQRQIIHFTKDLGLDSLNVVELMLAIEEEFCLDIPVDVSEKLHTVDDAINFVPSHPQAQ